MEKKKKVEVKAEEMFGRDGVSIYINGDLSKHVTTARALWNELKFLDELKLFDVVFKR